LIEIITRVFRAFTGGAQGPERGRDDIWTGIFERSEERPNSGRLALYLAAGMDVRESGLKILSSIF
jgi:hypothetical protein